MKNGITMMILKIISYCVMKSRSNFRCADIDLENHSNKLTLELDMPFMTESRDLRYLISIFWGNKYLECTTNSISL